MNAFRLIIDGKACEAEDGQTILDVAKRHGITIPSLCAHPKLEKYGGCRLCCVEVLADDQEHFLPEPKLVSACTTPAQSASIVITRSERIDAFRQMTLALLRGRMGDDAAALRPLIDTCGIHPLAADMRALFDGEEDDGGGEPLRNCILCGLCVRACDKRGKHALIMEGMGDKRRVLKPAYDGESPCDDCGLCKMVCPTDAASFLQYTEMKA